MSLYGGGGLYSAGAVLKDWDHEVADGNIPGHTAVNKFGRNSDVDSAAVEDIWTGGGVWVAPTQARIHALVSTDDNDGKTGAPNSTGARRITVYGLTAWTDTAETSENVTLDGTTPVNTSNSYVIIYRMTMARSGTSGPNIGTITATAATDATVTARIEAGIGQTEMAIFGVPTSAHFHMNHYYASINKGAGAAASGNMLLLVNESPAGPQGVTVFTRKHTLGLQQDGSSLLTHSFRPHFVVSGPAIIKVQADMNTDNTDVSAGFDGYIDAA